MRFTVKQVMTKRVASVPDSASVDEVFDLLLRHNVSGLPVVDGQHRLVAMISEADLLRLLDSPTAQSVPLSLLWTRDVIAVRPDDAIPDVIDLFLAHQLRRIPVVDDHRKLVGVVSRRNVIKMIREVRTRVASECRTLHQRATASAMVVAAAFSASTSD
jgi:CBS domain-containing protein